MPPLGGNVGSLELMANLTGLTHDIFVGDVRDLVRRESPTANLMQDAPAGFFTWSGQKTVFAVDLDFKTSGRATDGKLPLYTRLDAVQGQAQPIRRYDVIALDNLVELLASGQGSFEDIGRRIQRHLWSSWKSMEIRQSIGDSTGLVAKVSSRTSSTVVVLKDGYGNVGTNPVQHLSKGAIIAWFDVSANGWGGAARISSIDFATNAVTVDSASTWEPSAAVPEANDLVYFATVPDRADAQFVGERNLAPNGIGTILDPAANATTVFGISQTTYPRWKPYRKPSVTFDHMEVSEFFGQLAARRGFDVTPATDACITHPSCIAQLNRSLLGFQQQANLGATFEGGYKTAGMVGNEYEPTAALVISGVPIYGDTFFYHNVFAVLFKEALFRVNVGGEADFWAGDGSMWQRTAGYDGKDAFVAEYMNYVSNHRGAHGALTGITLDTDLSASDWVNVPNY